MEKTGSSGPRYIDAETAAKELCVSHYTVRRWLDRGIIPPEIGRRFGATVKIRREAFYKWLDETDAAMEASDAVSK